MYSTECDPGTTCPEGYRPDDLSKWVVGSLDGSESQELDWTSDFNPFFWMLLSGDKDQAQVLSTPGGYWMNEDLSDVVLLTLPSGDTEPFPFDATTPDMLAWGGVHFSTGVTFDFTLTRGLFISQDHRGTPTLVLRDLEHDTNLREIRDTNNRFAQALLRSIPTWMWSYSSDYVAFPYPVPNLDDSGADRVELFVLDRSGDEPVQMTQFDEIAGDYSVAVSEWARDDSYLAFNLFSQGRNQPGLVDLSNGRLVLSCLDGIGTWSPSGQNVVDLQRSELGLVVIEVWGESTFARFAVPDLAYIQQIVAWLP